MKDSGKISHDSAMNKAYKEYSTYRAQIPDDLSEVEKAYLETLRDMQKKLKAESGGDF